MVGVLVKRFSNSIMFGKIDVYIGNLSITKKLWWGSWFKSKSILKFLLSKYKRVSPRMVIIVWSDCCYSG